MNKYQSNLSKTTLTILAGVLLGLASGVVEAQSPDAMSSNPAFSAYIRQHPTDWEKNLHPQIRPIVAWQRIIGMHGQVIGYADNQANSLNPKPTYLIQIAKWDGTDLFALGIPKTINNKPVQFWYVEDMAADY